VAVDSRLSKRPAGHRDLRLGNRLLTIMWVWTSSLINAKRSRPTLGCRDLWSCPLLNQGDWFETLQVGGQQAAMRALNAYELPPLSRSAGYLAPVGSRVVPDGSG